MEPAVGNDPTTSRLQGGRSTAELRWQIGGLGGARSHNVLIKNQVLYLLSYQPVAAPSDDLGYLSL